MKWADPSVSVDAPEGGLHKASSWREISGSGPSAEKRADLGDLWHKLSEFSSYSWLLHTGSIVLLCYHFSVLFLSLICLRFLCFQQNSLSALVECIHSRQPCSYCVLFVMKIIKRWIFSHINQQWTIVSYQNMNHAPTGILLALYLKFLADMSGCVVADPNSSNF